MRVYLCLATVSVALGAGLLALYGNWWGAAGLAIVCVTNTIVIVQLGKK